MDALFRLFCMLTMLWAALSLSPQANWQQIGLYLMTSLVYVLCHVQDYRRGCL